jgi:hypothetical protein
MSKLHAFPISPCTTGTTATTALYKGLRGIAAGTCSGTQVEQWERCTAVPALKVEQEHKWNSANRCWAWVCGVCSGVPLVITVAERDLLRCRFRGVTQ